MDAKLKAKWIKALRSGKYEQTTGKLHDKDLNSFCCLGVLCAVVGATFGSTTDEDDNFLDHVPIIDGRILSAGDDGELSKSFAREIGIPDQSVLIRLNDGNALPSSFEGYVREHSFSEIADYIEREL